MAKNQIKTVAPDSPAGDAGVRPGERLLSINGHRIVDVLDYKYYSYDPDLTLELGEEDGETTVRLLRVPDGAGFQTSPACRR